MRGNDKVLKDLGEALQAELTAINQYFLHARMCESWGSFQAGCLVPQRGHHGQSAIGEIGLVGYLAQQLHKAGS
jgi:hypothetical protein